MNATGKILTDCGVLLLIPVLAVAAFILYLKNDPQMQEYSKLADEARDQGRYFAKTTDQYGCLQLGLSRADQMENPTRYHIAANGAYVRECLEGSKPTPNFCENVPTVVVREWARNRCKSVGREDEAACHIIYDEQTRYCLVN